MTLHFTVPGLLPASLAALRCSVYAAAAAACGDVAAARAAREAILAAHPGDAATAAALADSLLDPRIPGGVEVHARGKVHTASVDMASGDPWSKDTLFTDEALRQKFIGMVCGTNPGSVERRKKAERIIESVDRLEQIKDLAELCDKLGTDSQR